MWGRERGTATAVVLGAALAAAPVLAAVEGPGVNQRIPAARASGRIVVDGTLDEAAWAAAPVFSDFVQRFPTAGAPPSERTELRVLYDEENVYFGVVARDSEPQRIDRRLGRRDVGIFSDAVQVMIDSTLDHRTAYVFGLTAGGVQSDMLLYDDRNYTSSWDGVWAGASGRVEDGWVAEFAIPLSLLRFPAVPVQEWGIGVRRDIARKNEEIDSVANPRDSNANASRFGHLTGLENLQPRRRTEVIPYVAARSVSRPQYSDAVRPEPRLLEPSLDVGADLRTALTSDLSLSAAINPDFGEVEADQLVLNLSTFESFFPEKRPFFTQGLELFEPVGSNLGVSQQLFYSRRIGLETPILGAAKVTGTARKGLEVSLLDAVVMGPSLRDPDEDAPDRRWRLSSRRPFHLGPNSALPSEPQVPTNFFAGVARARVGAASRLGVTATAATPLERGCTAEQAELDEELQPAGCFGRGGNAGAVDFSFNTADGKYSALGQLTASQTVGGPPSRTLRDGTDLRRGATGTGGYLKAGKLGGEGFRWDVGYDLSSPTLDLNATGFQRTQNEHGPRASVRYHRQNGLGPLRAFGANLSGWVHYTTDGRGLHRDTGVNVNGYATLPSFDAVGVEWGLNGAAYDVRQLGGTGVPLEFDDNWFAVLWFDSNPGRPVMVNAAAVAGYHAKAGPAEGAWGWAGNLSLTLRPHDAVETRLEVNNDRTPFGPRYIDTLQDDAGGRRFLLGNLESNYLTFTLRQSWVIRPQLTLQAYAQLFTDYGHYKAFYEGISDAERTPVRLDELTPTTAVAADQNFYDTFLNVNVVLRWEYRLGSTLFAVYSRTQEGLPVREGVLPRKSLLPAELFRGPGTDAFMLKWSYYWDV